MAYEKIGFNKGDVLKAEHLNHIEEALYANSNTLIGSFNDFTPDQVFEAISKGNRVVLTYTHEFFGEVIFTNFTLAKASKYTAAFAIAQYNGQFGIIYLAGNTETNSWNSITKVLLTEDFT